MILVLYSLQHALKRLEDAGIIAAQAVGKTRVYPFNTSYPFNEEFRSEELRSFIEKAYTFLPLVEKMKYEDAIRTRPRKMGKL